MYKLSPTDIADIFRARAAGATRIELAGAYGVTPSALHYWKRYAGLPPEWITRIMELEKLNKRLSRRCVAISEQGRIAAHVIKQFVPSARKRSLMSPALQSQFHVDRLTANAILGLTPGAGVMKVTQRDDAELIVMMKRYSEANPGQGFAKMFRVLLQNQPGTRSRALRIYKAQKLLVRDRPKHVSVPRRVKVPMKVQGKPDQVWSMDFLLDALPSGRRFWVLNVLDDFNREALATRIFKRHSAVSVVATLEQVAAQGRVPKSIRTDNGKEFKSATYLAWMKMHNSKCIYIRSHQATENAYVERFNRTLRGEVLSRYRFKDMAEAQRMLEDWRARYNVSRPHESLGGLSPMQFAYSVRQSWQ